MRKSEIPVAKVSMTLFAGDAEKLRELFPRQGASFMVRNLVRQFLRKVEEDTRGPSVDIDINELVDEPSYAVTDSIDSPQPENA